MITWLFKYREQRRVKKDKFGYPRNSNEQSRTRLSQSNRHKGGEKPTSIGNKKETNSRQGDVRLREHTLVEEEKINECRIDLEERKEDYIISNDKSKTFFSFSDSTISRIVEINAILPEMSPRNSESFSDSPKRGMLSQHTIESEKIFVGERHFSHEESLRENLSQNISELHGNQKVLTGTLTSQLEKSKETISFGFENENPYYPSMLRLGSFRQNENDKNFPWLKRKKPNEQ